MKTKKINNCYFKQITSKRQIIYLNNMVERDYWGCKSFNELYKNPSDAKYYANLKWDVYFEKLNVLAKKYIGNIMLFSIIAKVKTKAGKSYILHITPYNNYCVSL